MAVLRAQQFWVKQVAANTNAQLYQCPAGYRAIVRYSSMVLQSTPTSGETAAIALQPTVGLGAWVYWNWFLKRSANLALWQLADQWEPTLTLKAGDRLTLYNATNTVIHAFGAGMLLTLTATADPL